ncbi:MAG: glutaredoxin family protein [Chloroflexi bacterium]|nr:glutaredoxin family protein [Chloroflexota bacterium]
MNKELIMYHRTYGCPFVTVARQVLADYGVPYREVFIDQDAAARERVIAWTGFQSVPTLVVANPGELLPYEPPAYLEHGLSPRGINRGSMITEPSADQLTFWLKQHGFIAETVTE